MTGTGAVTVRVPASTSNLGAGFDCLGMALDLWLEVHMAPGEGNVRYGGTLSGLDPDRDILRRPLVGAGLAGGIDLTADSRIPVARGLGSSAAAAVAGHVLAHLARTGTAPDRDETFAVVTAMEGHPDNAAPAVYGGAVLSVGGNDGAAKAIRLDVHPSVGIALAVPDQAVETGHARRILPATYPRDAVVAQAAGAAALVTGLRTGDAAAIAAGMVDRIAVPYRRQLIRGFEEAVAEGTAGGAFGVTVSGSGSAILALAPRDAAVRVAAAMAQALTASGNPAVPLTPAVSATGFEVRREG